MAEDRAEGGDSCVGRSGRSTVWHLRGTLDRVPNAPRILYRVTQASSASDDETGIKLVRMAPRREEQILRQPGRQCEARGMTPQTPREAAPARRPRTLEHPQPVRNSSTIHLLSLNRRYAPKRLAAKPAPISRPPRGFSGRFACARVKGGQGAWMRRPPIRSVNCGQRVGGGASSFGAD